MANYNCPWPASWPNSTNTSWCNQNVPWIWISIMSTPRITMSIKLIQIEPTYLSQFKMWKPNRQYMRTFIISKDSPVNTIVMNNLIKFCIMYHNISSVIVLKELLHSGHIKSPGQLSLQTKLRNQGNDVNYCSDCNQLDVQLRLHFNPDVYNKMF